MLNEFLPFKFLEHHPTHTHTHTTQGHCLVIGARAVTWIDLILPAQNAMKRVLRQNNRSKLTKVIIVEYLKVRSVWRWGYISLWVFIQGCVLLSRVLLGMILNQMAPAARGYLSAMPKDHKRKSGDLLPPNFSNATLFRSQVQMLMQLTFFWLWCRWRGSTYTYHRPHWAARATELLIALISIW